MAKPETDTQIQLPLHILDGLALILDRSPMLIRLCLPDVLGVAVGLAEHLCSLVDVVDAAEQDVDLLERDLLGLGDEEPDEDKEDNVHAHEEEEALETDVVEESREELVEDGIGDVLRLRAHTHGLGADVHSAGREG